MARANVTLRNAEAFTSAKGVSWRKGQARILTAPVEIQYYRNQSEFVVTDLPDATGAKKPKLAPELAPKPVSEPAGEDGKSGDQRFTEKELERLNKSELVNLAADCFGLVLDGDEPKKVLVAAIFAAQG